MNEAKSSLQGVLFALLSFALYATHDVFVKHLGGFYSPFQILFFAVLFSFPLATLYALRNPRTGSLWPHHPVLMLVRVLAILLTGLCAFFAFSVLALPQTYALLFFTPVLITMLSIPLLGERVGLHRWSAVLVGFLGVLVVLQPTSSSLNLGHLAGVGAAFGAAVTSLVTRRVGQREKTSVMLIYPLLGNFFLIAPVLPFVYLPMPMMHLVEIALISLLGFLAMICIVTALQRANAGIIAPMQYSQIIWAGIFATTIFDHQMSWSFALGTTLIVLSGLYIVRREWTKADSMQPVISNGTFRPDSGLRPRFAISGLFWKSGQPPADRQE